MKKIAIISLLALASTVANAEITFNPNIPEAQQQKVIDTLTALGGKLSPSKLNVKFTLGNKPKGQHDPTPVVTLPASFYAGTYKHSRPYCAADDNTKSHTYNYARILAHETLHAGYEIYKEHFGATDQVIEYVNSLPESLVGPKGSTIYNDKTCL